MCSGHGQCQDRLLGSGECRCHEGFHGTACEMCELGRYGPNCGGGEPQGGQRTEAWRQPSQGRVEALGNSCPPLSCSQSVTVPTACARRGFKGTAAVSVMWAGRAPAVTRVSSLHGEGRVIPGEVVPWSKRPEPSSCPLPSQRSLALNAQRSATPMPSECAQPRAGGWVGPLGSGTVQAGLTLSLPAAYRTQSRPQSVSAPRDTPATAATVQVGSHGMFWACTLRFSM